MQIVFLAFLSQILCIIWASYKGTTKELLANAEIPNRELALLLNIAVLAFTTIYTSANGLSLTKDISMQSIPTVLIGASTTVFTVIFSNLMIHALPLAVVQMCWSFSPFMTALAVKIALGEAITRPTYAAMTICFLVFAYMAYLHRNEKSTETEELGFMPYSF